MDTIELFGYLTSKYDTRNDHGHKAQIIIDYTLSYIECTDEKRIKVKDIYKSATNTIGSKKRFSYVYFINVLKTKWELEKENKSLILDVANEVNECFIF